MKDMNIESKHDYVDLGLSVKWATCNIGATKPEEPGDFYAWGEVKNIEGQDTSNYKYWKHDGSLVSELFSYYRKPDFFPCKYNIIDNYSELKIEDDVANIKWGEGWRVPSVRQLCELMNECTWIPEVINNICGFKVTSNKKEYDNNSIFIPAVFNQKSVRFGTIVGGGNYWSSSIIPHESLPNITPYSHAISLFFRLVKDTKQIMDWRLTESSRECGCLIRPIHL